MKECQRSCLKCGRSPAINDNTRLYRFPKPGKLNSKRCESWSKYCYPKRLQWSSVEFQKKLHSNHRMLCDKHFKKSAFINQVTKQLYRYAVPGHQCENRQSKRRTILTKKDVTMEMPEEPCSSQTNISYSANLSEQVTSTNVSLISPKEIATKKEDSQYNECIKQVQQICQLKYQIGHLNTTMQIKKISNNENVHKLLNLKNSLGFTLPLKEETKNSQRKIHPKRWSLNQKIMSLCIYKRSQTCYRLLRTFFSLPGPRILRNLLKRFELDVGYNEKLFYLLKTHAKEQKLSDNQYILLFGQMSIRKHFEYDAKNDRIDGVQDHGIQGRSLHAASHAIIFMIAGIQQQIKQPVAFYFSGTTINPDRLCTLLVEVMHHCFAAGLNIVATVCHMDDVNKKTLGLLGASKDQPQITVEGREVITLFDPPHLFRCFRNLFIKHNIVCPSDIIPSATRGDGVARWSHIEWFYEKDNNNPYCVLAPKLREKHINPNSKQKMKLHLATQILSHSVAVGMFAKIARGELPPEAAVTANVIKNMDELFDSLNSDRENLEGGKKLLINLTENSPHIDHYKKMTRFFQNISFKGFARPPPSQEGWVWTLTGVEMLWNNMNKKHNIRYLSTRRLQMYPLEDMFNCIREYCGANHNPTTAQFIAGYKTALVSKLTRPGADQDDINDLIIKDYEILIKPPCISGELSKENSIYNELQNRKFEESLVTRSVEMEACSFVSEFIFKNTLIKSCKICKMCLFSRNIQRTHMYVEFIDYSNPKHSVTYTSQDFIHAVEASAGQINVYLNDNYYKRNLKNGISKSLGVFGFLKQCTNHYETNVKNILDGTWHICVERFCVDRNRMFAEEASKVQKEV